VGIAENRKKVEERQRQVREEVDAYERTISTIICFDSAVRWIDEERNYLDGSYFLPCRRLSKPENGGDVTPDIVIQLSAESGVVAEVKMTASTENDFGKAHAQMKKYDQDLMGWKTDDERIGTHDLALLVDDLRRNAARDYFEGNDGFVRRMALVACAIQRQAREICKIEKYYGNFTDQRVELKLRNPVAVSLEALIGRISAVKFYDGEPPLEYTMVVLWLNVFPELKERETKERDQALVVDCGEVTEILREKYSFGQEDRRQPKIPKQSWVKKALDAFVSIDYADRDRTNVNRYQIKYSYGKRGDLLSLFSKKLYEVANRPQKKTGKQGELLFVSG
jgi:hypothetical protein